MNCVTVSKNYSRTIKVNSKTYILYLRKPETIEVYGYGIDISNPMIIPCVNPTEKDTIDFEYSNDMISECLKKYKMIRKNKKK